MIAQGQREPGTAMSSEESKSIWVGGPTHTYWELRMTNDRINMIPVMNPSLRSYSSYLIRITESFS